MNTFGAVLLAFNAERYLEPALRQIAYLSDGNFSVVEGLAGPSWHRCRSGGCAHLLEMSSYHSGYSSIDRTVDILDQWRCKTSIRKRLLRSRFPWHGKVEMQNVGLRLLEPCKWLFVFDVDEFLRKEDIDTMKRFLAACDDRCHYTVKILNLWGDANHCLVPKSTDLVEEFQWGIYPAIRVLRNESDFRFKAHSPISFGRYDYPLHRFPIDIHFQHHAYTNLEDVRFKHKFYHSSNYNALSFLMKWMSNPESVEFVVHPNTVVSERSEPLFMEDWM